MTQRTERPPVRARSGRRPLPPLIFLLVLALAALGVWWKVMQQHEAQTVAGDLQGRGFVVDEIANDPTDREVTGVGEVRHGPRGNDAARYLTVFLPGASDFLDTRATAQVDLVLGPDFQTLATPEQVAAALQPAASASAAC